MSKHSNKIWRTVVFSGAMLGTQVVAADTPKPAPQQQSKPKPPPHPLAPRELAQRDYDDATKRVNDAMTAITAAASQADRDAAKAKLDAARADRAAAEKKLAGYPPPTPTYQDPAAVKKLEKTISDLDVRIGLTVDTVAGAKSDADRKLATTKLASLRKERDDATTKLVAEKAKPPKRPRQPDEPRPTGRGFILS